MRRHRNKSTLLVIKGVAVEVVSVSGLAEIIGKSRDSVLKYEAYEIFPPAIFTRMGYRYYPTTLAKALKPIVAQFPPNKRPSAETIAQINKLFNEERQKYA